MEIWMGFAGMWKITTKYYMVSTVGLDSAPRTSSRRWGRREPRKDGVRVTETGEAHRKLVEMGLVARDAKTSWFYEALPASLPAVSAELGY